MKIWKRFYECDCTSEGIMLSYEMDDPYPVIDIAFYTLGFNSCKELGLFQRLRWAWRILRKGTIWNDMVILRQSEAKKLGKDLK